MREEYVEKDFVYFVGKPSEEYDISKEIIAQINEIEKNESYWKVNISIIEPYEKCECLIDLIRPIQTKEKHLLNLEFKKNHTSSIFPLYKLGELTVTELSFFIPGKNHFLYLGYFKEDLSFLSDKENIIKYLDKNDEFDLIKFNNSFVNLNNFNDLIKELTDIKEADVMKIMYS